MDILSTIFDAAQPLIVDVASVVVLAAVGAAAEAFRRKTGIEIEARHREALHSALMSGVRAALARDPNAGQADVVLSAIKHARSGSPDAVKALKASDDAMQTIATRLVGEVVDRRGND